MEDTSEPLWRDVVAASARRRPEAVAVSGVGPTLSYARLDALSERLAERLITLGVRQDRLVALLMERTSALVVALYAVAKAGGAHLPLEPTHPPERLAFMLGDTAPTLVITDSELAGGLLEGYRVLHFGPDDLTDEAPIPSRKGHRPGVTRDGEAAYAIFTSGSSGKPKSVLITHRGVMNMVRQQIEHLVVRPDSRVLQCASIGFDAAFSEIAMALCAGARLELATAAELAPGPPLAATVARRAVTHLTITPSALAALDPAELPSVTTLIVAGEACPPSLVDRWAGGRRMVNAYGPTETTVCATMSDPLTGGASRGVPIGRPLAGTSAEVLDDRLCPVPAGVAGELWVGGPGVARGYLGRPGLTAERFLADPRGKPGSRMYRTGDLARADEGGVLWFLGRDDDQVKIRGHRVDLGEVAAVLGEHPAVRDLRVTARPDAHGANRLTAYIVPAEPGAPVAGTLRAWARTRLPEAMVPAVMITLDRLPLNANGKLDLAALPVAAPAGGVPVGRQTGRPTERAGYAGEGTPPQHGAPRLLCDLFADTLDLGGQAAGPDEDFFDLGGNSLTGTLLLARVRKVFGVRLTLPDLAQASTPRALAARLREAGRDLGAGELLALRPRGEGAPVFCLPPATGLGWSYGRLLGAIAPVHPVYALQSPGLRDGEPPIEDMPGLVEHCIRLIRRTQREGPYHLVGWSFGGVLAHAVAVALRGLGQQIGTLALLDAYPGRGGTLAATSPASRGSRYGESGIQVRRAGDPAGGPAAELAGGPVTEPAGELAGGPVAEPVGELAGEPAGGPVAELVAELAGELDEGTARRVLADSLGADVPWPDRVVQVLRANVRMQRRHEPGVFDGPATLFCAEFTAEFTSGRPGERPDPATWRPYLSEPPRVLPVPAGHHDLLGPAALAVIAPVLAELLGDHSPAAPAEEMGRRPDPLDGPCHVLRNDAGQFSLWPTELPVPAGWQISLAERDRAACVAFVERAWTDPMLLGGPDDRV